MGQGKIFPKYGIVLKEKKEQAENKEKCCSTFYCFIYCLDKLCSSTKSLEEHNHQ